MTLRITVFCLTLLGPTLVLGHEDLNTVIANLSERISKQATADLFCARGLEYRAARETAHALSDFRKALELEPAHQTSLKNLSLLLSKQDQHQDALANGTRLLKLSPTPEVHLLLADLYFAAGKKQRALGHAQKGPTTDERTFLLQACLLQDPLKASRILAVGHQETKSIVLRNAWIDSLIAAGELAQAAPLVEEEIATSRFSASWRIRKARIAQSHGNSEAAVTELETALAEITSRLAPTRPDLTLIHDRGLALALLGKKKAAQKDLERLQSSEFDPLSYLRLATLLGE